jgi:serine/threonine protein kinase
VISSFRSKYDLGEELGRGGYSVVKLATNKISAEQVAVKIVSRIGLPDEDEKSLRQEACILKSLQHPNIIKIIEFIEEPNNFYLVLEYIEGGELFDRIVDKVVYSEREARDVVNTLLSAIKYCHNKNVVHRDLKPENLLLKSRNNDWDLRVADFGFAVIANGNSITDSCGTPSYIAPEIISNIPYGIY